MTSETDDRLTGHDDVVELLGVYALDAVDQDERALVDAHLPTCPRCQAEVAEHRAVAAMLANTGADAPEGVWRRIVESLEDVPPAFDASRFAAPTSPNPVSESGSADAVPSGKIIPFRRRASTWLPIGAAAAAVAVIGLIVGVGLGSSDTSSVASPTLADVARQVEKDPTTQIVDLVSADGSDIVTVAIDEHGDAYLFGRTLPALDAAQTYQLWAVSDSGVISIGVLGHAPDVVAFRVDDSVQQLLITEELAGGVEATNNTPILAVTIR